MCLNPNSSVLPPNSRRLLVSFLTSDFRYQMSDIRPQTSDLSPDSSKPASWNLISEARMCMRINIHIRVFAIRGLESEI